jgi:hypothetical protein
MTENNDSGCRRKFRLIESNAKCRHLKKFTCKGTLQQVFICLRPPPLLGFCMGWSSKFVGSESGQIQSVKLLQNMVSNTTQHPTPPPSHTLSVYNFDTGKGGGSEGREVNQREG